MAPLKEGPVSPEGPVLNEVPLPTVTQCHFILQTDYCQCHTASITNSQRRGRQLVSTAHHYVLWYGTLVSKQISLSLVLVEYVHTSFVYVFHAGTHFSNTRPVECLRRAAVSAHSLQAREFVPL